MNMYMILLFLVMGISLINIFIPETKSKYSRNSVQVSCLSQSEDKIKYFIVEIWLVFMEKIIKKSLLRGPPGVAV